MRPSNGLQLIENIVFFSGRGRAGMLGLHFCPRRQECSGYLFVFASFLSGPTIEKHSVFASDTVRLPERKSRLLSLPSLSLHQRILHQRIPYGCFQ
jgi:hypothetical protein